MPAHQPHRLALLVGISTYPGTQPCDLSGPENDISLVAQLLRDRFAVPAANIVTLLDDQATHAAIVETFRTFLIANAKPDTEVIFWYCGHGSRIVDRSGHEADGLDNALVAHDSRVRAADGGYDVSDDELHTLLQQLAAITGRIVVVTDACHSESAFRGDAEQVARDGVRYAGKGTAALDAQLVAPLWKDQPILEDGAPERRPIADRFVHVAACMRWQLARERAFDGRMHGVLSWHLVRALARAQPGQTWRQVIEQVQLLVQETCAGQTPTFDGLVDREVFGGKFVPPPRGMPVRRARRDAGGHDLLVDAGELTGLAVGSVVRVHPLHGDQVLGDARVSVLQPDGLHALAKWMEPKPRLQGTQPEDEQPLRAVEIARPGNTPRLRTAVAPPGLARQLDCETWVTEVLPSAAEYVLEPAAGDGGCTLRTTEGVVIWPAPRGVPENARATAPAILENAMRFRALARLPLEPGEFRVTARFVAPMKDDRGFASYGERIAKVEPESSPAGTSGSSGNQWHCELPRARAGEPDTYLATLEVTNRGANPVHVVVVSLEEAGCRRAPIWGYLGEDRTLLEPAESMRISVSLSRLPGGSETWSLPRPMRDRYLVIATPKPMDVRRLTAWGNDREAKPQSAKSWSEEPLPWVLDGAFAAAARRSGEMREADRSPSKGVSVEDRPRAWGVTWVDLFVQ